MLTFSLETNTGIPLYRQIYEYIKKEILSGSLRAGDKLPSSRTLATHLAVSRNTVEIAYEQLLCEGYIDALPRKGYFVAELTYHTNFSVNTSIDRKPVSDIGNLDEFRFDFSPNNVDMTPFPHSIWRRLSKEQMNDTTLFSLGDYQGDENFRQAIANYLHGSRGVNCQPAQIVIGAGVDYLLLLLTLILNPKGTIAMENPAYKRARRIFSSADFKIDDIPVLKSGMDLTMLKKSTANYCYVTPSHQFPLGTVMPAANRQKLLAWAAEKEERYIIEDDHDSEFRYKGKPIPALQGMDRGDNVIYIGTFSRAIAPAIRVGYMVLPLSLCEKYKTRCSYFACTVSRIDQARLTSFIQEGYFEKHLNRMRKVYKTKHDLVLSLLDTDKVEIVGGNAGLYVVVHLKNKTGIFAENEIIERARQYGIKLYGLSEYYSKIDENYQPGFLFGFAPLSEKELKEGISLLNSKVL
ncbi:MAG: PLP-dependent aminotransferase family protein [Lachnospiraceae bacterium]|nr:PLP-dependent aminotransferase family protein [Lachnospiraceae bacterium]